MAKTYFQFKQFTIHQDKCAMKVCTDACLFGALLPPNPLPFRSAQDEGKFNVLDIGTGTGLLSLMLAQKNSSVKIDAVEIDTDAALQAKENIAASPWADRIHIFNEDISGFDPGKKYYCIISNPPFFEDDLPSPDKAKNKAKHDTSLSLIQLLQVIDKHLTTDGFFAVLLPYQRVEYFITEATKIGFHLYKQILVKQTINHTFFRGILFFSRKEKEPEISELTIKDTNQDYTAYFIALLKDYYLYL